jgi:hypothetical protein
LFGIVRTLQFSQHRVSFDICYHGWYISL